MTLIVTEWELTDELALGWMVKKLFGPRFVLLVSAKLSPRDRIDRMQYSRVPFLICAVTLSVSLTFLFGMMIWF